MGLLFVTKIRNWYNIIRIFEYRESKCFLQVRYKTGGECMGKLKIAFFDIDGTLIDMKTKRMSQKVEEALIRLKENNVLLCLATGRAPNSIPQFENIEFDAFLTFNGSYCYTKRDIILKNTISANDVQQIIENASTINRPVSIASAVRTGANGKDQDLIDYFLISNQQVEVLEDFNALAAEDIYQIMLGCRTDEYEKILENVDGAKITAWWTRAADIIPANGGKGIGVQKILEYYNLEKDTAIAFGDGTNDIDMLELVGTGVAMGNATDDVKAVADAVCGRVDEDGIYSYCLEKNLF